MDHWDADDKILIVVSHGASRSDILTCSCGVEKTVVGVTITTSICEKIPFVFRVRCLLGSGEGGITDHLSMNADDSPTSFQTSGRSFGLLNDAFLSRSFVSEEQGRVSVGLTYKHGLRVINTIQESCGSAANYFVCGGTSTMR